MVPAVVLLAGLAVIRCVGWLGVAALDNWDVPLRAALAIVFLLTASAHWGRGRGDLIRMHRIGSLLRTGVIAAAVIVFASGVWYLALFGALVPNCRTFHGEPANLRTPRVLVMRTQGQVRF